MCVPRERKRKNEKKIEKCMNENYGDKSECMYDRIKKKLESTKVVNSVCALLRCAYQEKGVRGGVVSSAKCAWES